MQDRSEAMTVGPPGDAVSAPALEMRGITKRYPGVVANDHIDLDVRPGEIHALLGENGAGKTTLMNVLYGLATPDEGEILLDGVPVRIKDPADAIARGINMVHQHFMLVPVLSVADNILLGEETMANPIFLDRKEAHRRIVELGRRFGFEIDPEVKVGSLSVGWQQRVEILKALYRRARILVLDEPTAVLTPQETQEIFAVLRRLAAEGHSIIFISHKLYEVLEIADRITVIRRGRVVGQRLPSQTDEDDLAELMVGREVQLTVDRGESHPDGVMLQVEHLMVNDDRGANAVRDVSFDVRAGEILGVAGVAGNGQDELVEALIGLRKVAAGKVHLGGADVTDRSPRQMNEASVAFVPADRHRYGLVLAFPIADNLCLTSYYREPYSKGILRDDDAIEAAAEASIGAVRHSDALGQDPGRDPVRWQPAEARRCAGVRARPEAARARSADARARCRQHRIHPPPDDRQARRRDGDPARLGRARRGARAVRPHRGHVSRPDRRRRRRPDRRQERHRPAHGHGRARDGRSESGSAGVTGPVDARRPVRGLAARAWRVAALPILSIVLALIVGAILILASELLIPNKHFDPVLPLTAYRNLFSGAIGSPWTGDFSSIVSTLAFSAPLLLVGLSVGFGFRAGLFNIGGQGQFLIGALAACWVGLTFRTAPAPIAFSLAIVAGAIGGAVWGFIPGFLKAQSGAHEVVTTIMLNYIGIYVLAATVSGPLKAPGSLNPITEDVANAALPVLVGPNLHLGVIIAFLAALFINWLLFRTTLGFEVRTVGANPDAARNAGMRPRRLLIFTMSMAGLLSGLAGAGQILGINHQLNAAYNTTVGFDGIAVALLGRSNPIGIVFAALLFGAMRAGAGLMQIQAQIPPQLVDVLQATILLFLVAGPVLRRVFRLRGAAGLPETETISATYGSGGETVAP